MKKLPKSGPYVPNIIGLMELENILAEHDLCKKDKGMFWESVDAIIKGAESRAIAQLKKQQEDE